MAGAILIFSNGRMGFERCRNPDDGSQYLRAVIYHSASGRRTSAPVETDEVERFVGETLRQCLLARGLSEDDIVTRGPKVLLDLIKVPIISST